MTDQVDVVEVCELDPVRDRRWLELVQQSPQSSLFHTPEWLLALQRTYGYEPIAFTTRTAGASFDNGLVFCRVKSWLTGQRLVSLPFSDHCEPLVDDPARLETMLNAVARLRGNGARYIELRPTRSVPMPQGYSVAARFHLHTIDLRADLNDTFARFHKSHTQRAIRKAERVGVTIDVGRSPQLLREFYDLHKVTRRRHGVPVQPFVWFRNLEEAFGDRLSVYLARYEGHKIAAILTLVHKSTLVYKYGCSDVRYNRYGATPALFWRAVRDAKGQDLSEFDLGRSDLDDDGLVAFKNHLGARSRSLTYYRCKTGRSRGSSRVWKPEVVHLARTFLPRMIQTRVGSRFYKHFA